MRVRSLKSRREIRLMREACGLVVEAHRIVRKMVAPGVPTIEIDRAVERMFAEHEATPLFKGYPCSVAGTAAFPAVTCISIDAEVVHGIPSERILQEGEIVSVDTGCRLNGWCGDSAWTYAVGEISPEKQKLMSVGQEVLATAIREMAVHEKWSDVAASMAAVANEAGFGVVEDFVGHGIGREMHEDPQVPNYVNEEVLKKDFRIETGLVLAIEPMVNAGGKQVHVLGSDSWTVETDDGQPSVHFEHTVAMTADGPEILTAGVGE
jgi:methionyl aminopeptidase